MSDAAVSEARKAVNRLRRSLEKARREIETLAGAIRHAEGDDFPADGYSGAERRIDELMQFLDAEAERLQEKVFLSGGLEPGRIRRSSD